MTRGLQNIMDYLTACYGSVTEQQRQDLDKAYLLIKNVKEELERA